MTSCKSGQIKKSSYKRKSYKKKDGTVVSAARVAASCVPDRGQPGKGPKVLPAISDNMSLSKYGYSLKKPAMARRQSLKRASKKTSTLEVERRVNLIRNYSKWEPKNYEKLSADVEFMKREYAKEKNKSKKCSKK